jgi:hypothetical protein
MRHKDANGFELFRAGPLSTTRTTTLPVETAPVAPPSQPLILDAISLSEKLVEQTNSTRSGILSLDIATTFKGIRDTVNLTRPVPGFIPRPRGWPTNKPWPVDTAGWPVLGPTRVIPLLCKRWIVCPPYGPQVTDPPPPDFNAGTTIPHHGPEVTDPPPPDFDPPMTVSHHGPEVTDPVWPELEPTETFHDLGPQITRLAPPEKVLEEFLPPISAWPPVDPGDPPRDWDVEAVLVGLSKGTLPLALQDPDVSRAVAVDPEDLVGFAGVVAEAAVLWRDVAEQAPGSVMAVRSEELDLEKRVALETVIAIIQIAIWVYEKLAAEE